MIDRDRFIHFSPESFYPAPHSLTGDDMSGVQHILQISKGARRISWILHNIDEGLPVSVFYGDR
jgi:hypothetical protein